MKSPEGIIWCWKDNVDDILFIFRDNNQEIEINLRHIKNEQWFYNNDKCLLPVEKEFLKTIVNNQYGTISRT